MEKALRVLFPSHGKLGWLPWRIVFVTTWISAERFSIRSGKVAAKSACDLMHMPRGLRCLAVNTFDDSIGE